MLGSCCGAVGRAVASNIRGPGFESSHWQLLLNIYLLLTVCRKDENKEKEAGNGPFLKKYKYAPTCSIHGQCGYIWRNFATLEFFNYLGPHLRRV